ncbi:MAG: flagellar hook-length control protein FliK [Gammaproteobacteria bacterium]|nr:flagellar hook-length control protein FliK [Gammaproteobacteria bacterium]
MTQFPASDLGLFKFLSSPKALQNGLELASGDDSNSLIFNQIISDEMLFSKKPSAHVEMLPATVASVLPDNPEDAPSTSFELFDGNLLPLSAVDQATKLDDSSKMSELPEEIRLDLAAITHEQHPTQAANWQAVTVAAPKSDLEIEVSKDIAFMRPTSVSANLNGQQPSAVNLRPEVAGAVSGGTASSNQLAAASLIVDEAMLKVGVKMEPTIDQAQALRQIYQEMGADAEAFRRNFSEQFKAQLNQTQLNQTQVSSANLAANNSLSSTLSQTISAMRLVVESQKVNSVENESGSTGLQALSALRDSGLSATAAAQPPTLALHSRQWQGQFSQIINWMNQRGIEQAEIKLDPQELGPINLRLTHQNGEVQLVAHAQHAQTRELLEMNQERLREMLQQNGIQLGQFDVREDRKQSEQQSSHSEHVTGANASESEGAEEVLTSRTVSSTSLLDLFA